MNTQYTPGPWTAAGNYATDYDTKTPYTSIKASGLVIARVWLPTGPLGDAEGRANLAHILTACNAHDDLLSALRAAVEWDKHRPGAPGLMEVPKWVYAARAAIAKVEGV